MAFSFVRNCVNYCKVVVNNKASIVNSPLKSLVSLSSKNDKTIVRSFSILSKNKSSQNNLMPKVMPNKFTSVCSMHTKGDQELAAFLSEEIENEKKSQSSPVLPNIEGFEIKFNGAEVDLLRKLDGELVVISANVSNSVDAEDTTMDPNDTKEPQEAAEMKAKPDFRVNITKHKKTMSFLCCYATDVPEEDAEAYNDSFEITEVSMFEGDYCEKTYSVSGNIMDGYLYDLLMNFLEERGVTNDLVDKMVGLYTAYEHQLYINLLQEMRDFVKKST